MCFLDEFKAQNQNLVFTNSIYRRRHGNKYAPSDQISGLELIPMLSFCELRSRDHHNTTFTNFFTPSTLLVVLGIDTFFRYRYFSIPRFDTKFRYRYFSIPGHDTHFKNRYFSIPSFRYQSQVSIPKYRYPLRYFSIPSKYLKFVQAISAKQIFIF